MFHSESYSEAVAQEALSGLTLSRKVLPAKLLYDDEGCRLFGEITRLPEYYITRTENVLLSEIAPSLRVPSGIALVEYGASDETKASILFHWLDIVAYVPIDIAGPALSSMQRRLASSHQTLKTFPIEADFLSALSLPPEVETLPALGFFPGSTIGNLDPQTAKSFLEQVRVTLGGKSLFLVGADLRKTVDILIPAYDDGQGITAAFNMNVLVRLNREAAADFDLRNFQHRAVWNDSSGRVEMHLESQIAHKARVAGRTISFAAGETIHTENSYKHTLDGFKKLASSAGWETVQVWTDPKELFSIHLFEADDEPRSSSRRWS